MNYSKALHPFRNQPKILGTSVNVNEFSGLNVFLLVAISNFVSVLFTVMVLRKQQGNINIRGGGGGGTR
jgi:hypothetical protein